MSDLSCETITFLLTDIQGSTRLWEQETEAARAALARHDALALEVITAHEGRLIKPRGEGDSLFAVFDRASRALLAAGVLQQAYCRETWPTLQPLQVRMAVHTGEATARDGDYYGPTVNRCARIRAIAHGGQILVSQAAYDLARDALPPEGSVRDLGQHRLRDLQRPERIYQLMWPGCPVEFPPLISLDLFKHNLPRQLTSFIGRERELVEVSRMLSASHLLTITGMGGAGKTRMAQQVAVEALEAYPDGVWLVELGALSDPALVPKAIAEVLNIREEQDAQLPETLCRGVAVRQMLLLLDNCEHLADATAALVHRLLQSCQNLRILATSRSPLGVEGEAVWPLPTMTVPDRAETIALPDALDYGALRLFVERATAVHPKFALTAANLPAVTQICQRLDGIPLAIELAAARITVLTAPEIAARLDQSFRLLKTNNRQAPERHQTLQALIDWSFNLLSRPEQKLLSRLSVFTGGWTLDAAEAICSDGSVEEFDVLDLLSQLVRASLVLVDEQSDTRRYRLLETVRQYSQEKLELAAETQRLRDRHLRYFLEIAEQAAPHLTTADHAAWLAKLEVDHDNLRAALEWCAPHTRLQLAGALCRFWIMRGHIAEGRSRLEGALQRGRAGDASVRARAHFGLGMLLVQQGEHRAALNTFTESLTLYREIGDDQGCAETINYMGIALRGAGELLQALECCKESLQLYQKLGYRWGIAAVYNNMGIVTRDLDDLQSASDYYTQSWAIYSELGDTARIASVANNLGTLSLAREDFAAAHQFFTDAVKQFRKLEDRSNLARALHNLAVSDFKLSRHHEALPLHLESLKLAVELKDQDLLPYSLMGLAELAVVAEKQTLAAELLGMRQAICDRCGILPPPEEQQVYDRNIAAVREALGEQAFVAARDRGRGAPLVPERVAARFSTDID